MVQDLEEMVVSRLLYYKERNGTLPEQIIVYRDGVSEVGYDICATSLAFTKLTLS